MLIESYGWAVQLGWSVHATDGRGRVARVMIVRSTSGENVIIVARDRVVALVGRREGCVQRGAWHVVDWGWALGRDCNSSAISLEEETVDVWVKCVCVCVCVLFMMSHQVYV